MVTNGVLFLKTHKNEPYSIVMVPILIHGLLECQSPEVPVSQEDHHSHLAGLMEKLVPRNSLTCSSVGCKWEVWVVGHLAVDLEVRELSSCAVN